MTRGPIRPRNARYNGPPPVGAGLGALTRAAFKRHGFSEAHILSHWPDIVGPELATMTSPERLKASGRASDSAKQPKTGGTLIVRVDGPVAVELAHLEPQIIERINSYYGYRAIGRLKLVQGPLPPPPPRRFKRFRPLDTAEETALDQELQPIAEPGLHEALERLGRRVLGRKKRPSKT